MRANVTYKGIIYYNVEMSNVTEQIVAFRIYNNDDKQAEYVEQFLNDDKASVSFYSDYAFIMVNREHVTEIICGYKSL